MIEYATEFHGRTYPSLKLDGTHYRAEMIWPGVISPVKICSGCGRFSMTHLYGMTNDEDAIAWGYEGTGPLYCASAILGWVWSPTVEGWMRFTADQNALVHKLHTEVIANLPDNWTMTREELLTWLKDGTLPECITKQPKEK